MKNAILAVLAESELLRYNQYTSIIRAIAVILSMFYHMHLCISQFQLCPCPPPGQHPGIRHFNINRLLCLYPRAKLPVLLPYPLAKKSNQYHYSRAQNDNFCNMYISTYYIILRANLQVYFIQILKNYYI